MSKLVAQFDPSAGSGSFQAGAVNRCSTLWVMNESPNFVQLDFAAADTPKIIQPWYNKKLTLTNPVQTVTWAVVATLQADSPPVSLVFVELYDPSEDTSALLSGPLQRQTNVGNPLNVTTATTLQNDGNPTDTTVIEARPSGAAGPYFLVTNNGDVTMRGALTIAFKTGLVPPNVTIDDNGNDLVAAIGGLIGAGAFGGFAFSAINNGSSVTPFGIAQSPGVSPLSWIDAAGVLHAPAPIQLISGHQETGTCGTGGNVPAATNFMLTGVNFKTTMSNVPTSLTLVATITNVLNSVAADNISTTGFRLIATSSAAGLLEWYGRYTTVGNCLQAVDAPEQTFDHHCDACGHLTSAAPFADLTHSAVPGVSLSFTCPACGAVECFNTQLASADEADTTPQGSGEYATTRGAQATLIRQLMTALGLEVAA